MLSSVRSIAGLYHQQSCDLHAGANKESCIQLWSREQATRTTYRNICTLHDVATEVADVEGMKTGDMSALILARGKWVGSLHLELFDPNFQLVIEELEVDELS